MSKLGDLLIEIDSKRSRRRGFGEIAGLSERRTPALRWRVTALLVMVISMLAIPLAIPLRLHDATPKPVSAPLAVAPGRSPEGTYKISNDDRVRSLVEEGAQVAELGDLSTAERLLREAVLLRPGDAGAWNDLGVVLVRQGQTASAVKAFLRAIQLDPSQAEAHRNLGVVWDRQGRFADATISYRRFLDMSPEDHPSRDAVRRRLEEISRSRADR